MVGGESRKSRRPSAVAESKALPNSRSTSSRNKSGATSANTSLKGLNPFIERSVSNNATSKGRLATALTPMIRTSSENTRDVIVENALRRMGWRAGAKSIPQPLSSRDRRTLSRDRSKSVPVHRQLESVGRPMQNYSPTKASAA
jgi:hypothetical protein